jgi:hypothetical protein
MGTDAGTEGLTGLNELIVDAPFTAGAPAVTPDPNLNRKQRRRVEDAHRVGSALNLLADSGVRVLHDRSVPGTDGTIEHVVIANNGITVVRSARLMGRIRSSKGELYVGGANATLLVNGLLSRVNTVRHLVGGEAVVQGAFALMKRRTERVKFHGAIALGSPQALVDYLGQSHLDADAGLDIGSLADELEGIFLPTRLLS